MRRGDACADSTTRCEPGHQLHSTRLQNRDQIVQNRVGYVFVEDPLVSGIDHNPSFWGENMGDRCPGQILTYDVSEDIESVLDAIHLDTRGFVAHNSSLVIYYHGSSEVGRAEVRSGDLHLDSE